MRLRLGIVVLNISSRHFNSYTSQGGATLMTCNGWMSNALDPEYSTEELM